MLVFVYGTLKQGHHNHRLLAHTRFVGYATTNKKYQMLDAGFPVLLDPTDDEDGHIVSGEVYDVDAATAKRLDQLEGKGRMYNRIRTYVKMRDGNSVRVHYYVGVPKYWSQRYDKNFHSPLANGALNWPEGRPDQRAA